MEVVAALAVVGLLVLIVVQQVLHARERATLLDRIQAPEVVLHKRTARTPEHVPYDDSLWSEPKVEA